MKSAGLKHELPAETDILMTKCKYYDEISAEKAI